MSFHWILSFMFSGSKTWFILPLMWWSFVVRTFWHVEVIVNMVVLLLCNYGILNLQNPVLLSLQMTLYVVFTLCPEKFSSWKVSDIFFFNSQYITSLKINPAGNTLITGSFFFLFFFVRLLFDCRLYYFQHLHNNLWCIGAGDGTIGLFDMRTCGAINHLSVGPGYEVVFLFGYEVIFQLKLIFAFNDHILISFFLVALLQSWTFFLFFFFRCDRWHLFHSAVVVPILLPLVLQITPWSGIHDSFLWIIDRCLQMYLVKPMICVSLGLYIVWAMGGKCLLQNKQVNSLGEFSCYKFCCYFLLFIVGPRFLTTLMIVCLAIMLALVFVSPKSPHIETLYVDIRVSNMKQI